MLLTPSDTHRQRSRRGARRRSRRRRAQRPLRQRRRGEALLDELPRPDGNESAREREQVRERRVVDVRACRDGDHPGEAAGERPERVALAREPAAGESSGEADRDHHRDRAERRRREVDVDPTREDRRLDHQAGGVEAVEAGEDQHQPQQRQVLVVALKVLALPLMSYFPIRGPRLISTPSVKIPATPWTTPEAIAS